MKELLSVTIGPVPETALSVLFQDRYAPYGAVLLGNSQREAAALRFNFNGLVVVVTDRTLLEDLVALCRDTHRAALLARLRAMALGLIGRERDICERLVMRAYEAGYADATCGRGCASFRARGAGQFSEAAESDELKTY